MVTRRQFEGTVRPWWRRWSAVYAEHQAVELVVEGRHRVTVSWCMHHFTVILSIEKRLIVDVVNRIASPVHPGSSVDGARRRPDVWKRQLTAAGVLEVRIPDVAARSRTILAHLERADVGSGRTAASSRRPLRGARVTEISLAACP